MLVISSPVRASLGLCLHIVVVVVVDDMVEIVNFINSYVPPIIVLHMT